MTIPEDEYGDKKNRKRTVDWIITEGLNAVIFIECKTKRLSWKSKIALTDFEVIDNDLDYIASAVVQLYKSILDYQNNLYPAIKFSTGRKIYPLVVVLDN